MKKVIHLLLLGTLCMEGAKIEALQQAKYDYKRQRQIQANVFTQERVTRLLIIFRNAESSAEEEIEKTVGLKREKCILGKLCIYRNDNHLKWLEIKRRLAEWEREIESVSVYHTVHFERY